MPPARKRPAPAPAPPAAAAAASAAPDAPVPPSVWVLARDFCQQLVQAGAPPEQVAAYYYLEVQAGRHAEPLENYRQRWEAFRRPRP